MRNKFITLAAATLAVAGCGTSEEKLAEIEDYGEIGYADIVSYIVQGYQCRWITMDPENQGLSAVYRYCSPTAGAAIQDINGDGLKELLIGDDIDGTVLLYDIYTINRKDASLIHLAKGGERDTFTINGSGTIIENGSNSAFDSFTKACRIVPHLLSKKHIARKGFKYMFPRTYGLGGTNVNDSAFLQCAYTIWYNTILHQSAPYPSQCTDATA